MASTLEYPATPYQQRFLSCKYRYPAFIGGVRSGKSHAGTLWALLQTMRQPGQTGLIGGLTYPMLRDVVLPLWQDLVPEQLVIDHDKTAGITYMANGSKVLWRSLETLRQIDRIRGLTLSWAWVDEGPYLPEYAWRVLLARVCRGNRQIGLTGTPKGMNWVFRRWGERKYGKHYGGVFGVSSDTNPALDRAYYDNLRLEYTGEYLQQEFHGLWVAFEGLVYKELGRANIITKAMADTLRYDGYVYGYDSGYTNPRVLLQFGHTTCGRWVLLGEWYQTQTLLEDVLPVWQRDVFANRQGPVFCDPSAKIDIVAMQRAGIDARAGNNNVVEGIQYIKGLLSKAVLLVVEELCPHTMAEFNMYQWVDDQRKDEPVKLNDHAMDAMRYGLLPATARRVGIIGGRL